MDDDVTRPAAPAAASRPAQIVGRYELLERLGSGGMGTVYRARDLDLDRIAALKTMELEQQIPGAVERLRTEAAALARVRSPFVVQVYGFGRSDASFFIAMEYVAGPNLAAIQRAHAAHQALVPTARALTILRQLASGLGDVHAAGLVHRDIKPANIVIEEGTGRPVIVDFGLVTQAGSESERAEMGTPRYMAPEQLAEAAPMSASADVFAFGCMAFEMLTGFAPFQKAGGRRVDDVPARLGATRPDLAALEPVLLRALAREPAERFTNGRELEHALMAAIAAMSHPPRDLGDTFEELIYPRIRERPLRVLVVEDDAAFRRLSVRAAQLALLGVGIEVRGAQSGTDAVRSALAHPPDLVLLDYELPGLDGIATLTALRDIPGGNEARVIVITGRLPAAERWRFEVLGVSDIVGKPVELGALVTRIAAVSKSAGWIDPTAGL